MNDVRVTWTDSVLPCLEEAARVSGRLAMNAGRALKRGVALVDPDARAHVGQLPMVVLSRLGANLTEQRPFEESAVSRRPVLLVHGMAGHPGNFVGYQLWSKWRGRTGLHTVDLRRCDDVPAMAACVAAAIHDIAEREGVERVDVVAHSLGGIVVRAALEDAAVAAQVGVVVTLAAPHGGTYAARFAGTATAVELRPGSPLIASLGAPPVPFVTIGSDADVLVVPPEFARLADCPHVELRGLTHYSVLAVPAAFEAIDAALS